MGLYRAVLPCGQSVEYRRQIYRKSVDYRDKAGIDVDFYVPDEGLAVQVAYSIEGQARAREVESLVRLAAVQPDMRRFVIVTKQEQQTIEAGGVTIEVVPAWRFLLSEPALRAGA